MRNDRLDLTLLLEVLQAPPRERAVDLHSVDEGGDCDETVGLDILVELLGGGLVKEDGVLGLVLYYRRDAMSAKVQLSQSVTPHQELATTSAAVEAIQDQGPQRK